MSREMTYKKQIVIKIRRLYEGKVSICRINVTDKFIWIYVYLISWRWIRQEFIPTEQSVVIQSAISPHAEQAATTSAERPLFYPALKKSSIDQNVYFTYIVKQFDNMTS